MQDDVYVQNIIQLYHQQCFAQNVIVSYMLSLYLWVHMFGNVDIFKFVFAHNYAVVHTQQTKAGCKLLPRRLTFIPFWGVDFSVGDLNGDIWRNWFFKMVVFSSSIALLCKIKNIYVMKITIIREDEWILHYFKNIQFNKKIFFSRFSCMTDLVKGKTILSSFNLWCLEVGQCFDL